MFNNIILSATLNFDFTYIFLYVTLLFVFFVAGDGVSAGGSYWGNALLCSILFVVIVGSRFGRGNDYVHYVDVYVHDRDLHQPLFRYINTILRDWLGIGKYFIFYIYSAVFILCGFKFLENFWWLSRWMFPLFLISMLMFEEYEIRQAFSFSFVFLFMDEFISTHRTVLKTLLLLLYFLIILGIHSANILFLFAFFFIYYCFRKVIPYYYSIPVLLFSSYIFPEIYNISMLAPILNFLGSTGNEKFAQYTQGNAAEAWFGDSALQLDNARNPIIKILDFIANSSLMYFSYRYVKAKRSIKRRSCVTLTNLYIFGDISKQAFLYLEILNRMAGMFQRMWFVPFVIIVSHSRFTKLSLIEKVLWIMMIFLFYDFLKYIFAPDKDMTLFLWNVY